MQCEVCDEWVNLTMADHTFLIHTPHRMAYLCRYCEYADLVTDRFKVHVTTQHNSTINVEACFKPVVVFWALLECKEPECVFMTNNQAKLDKHAEIHRDDGGRTITLPLDELSADMQREVLVQQRRNMETPSLNNKRVERSRGLDSPPLELHLKKKPTQSVSPRTTPPSDELSPGEFVHMMLAKGQATIKGFGRGNKVHLQVKDGRDRKNWYLPMELDDIQPPRSSTTEEEGTHVATRTRSKMQGVRSGRGWPDEYTRAQGMQRKIFDLVKALPQPPTVARPMMTSLERAQRKRPAARYLAEIQILEETMYICFFKLVEPCRGAITHRYDQRSGSIVVAGVVVTLFAGAPGCKRGNEGSNTRWLTMGPIYDVQTRPWSVVRRIQLSSAPGPGGLLSGGCRQSSTV